MPRPSILDGLDVGLLRSRLAAMQQAYLDLTSGGKVEVASYAQADGARTVTYTRANLADLTAAILAVQGAIDRATGACVNRRGPIRPFF
jgi:hypothetical protein